jgi:anti-sigma B factor antagonist
MALEMTITGGIVLVTIPLRFDSSNAPAIEAELKTMLAGSPEKVVFDFSGTDYIASAGMRVLLQITRDLMKAGGRVTLAGLRPAVHKVFAMAGFTSIFSIYGSREEAMRAL